MKKTILLIIFLLVGLFTMNALIADKSYNKPTFALEFDIKGTGAEVRLNDIPVYYHDTPGMTASEKPIPESIIDGENVLTVRSFPLEEDGFEYRQNASVNITVSVREADAPLTDNQALLNLKVNPTLNKDQLLAGTSNDIGDNKPRVLQHNDKETIAERSTNINSPFPRWAWQDGQTIENSDSNYQSLEKKYKEIYLSLKSGEKNKIYPLYDNAAKEFALAYHHQDSKQGHRIMNTGSLANDKKWELGDTNDVLKNYKYYLDIFANGKLVRILDEDGDSPIVYYNPEADIISIQKFAFYKNQQGEWIMIR